MGCIRYHLVLDETPVTIQKQAEWTEHHLCVSLCFTRSLRLNFYCSVRQGDNVMRCF